MHGGGPWQSFDDVEYATLEWVAWFNGSRLFEALGDIPPDEYEQAYYQRQAATAELATDT